MANALLPEGFESQLRAQGFTESDQTLRGPMGSARLLLTDGRVDLLVYDDRGTRGVELGIHGGSTYTIQSWLRVLGKTDSAPLEIEEQLVWVLDHLAEVSKAVAGDVGLERRLRSENWESVKDRLGFRSDADPDNPRTWRRQ